MAFGPNYLIVTMLQADLWREKILDTDGENAILCTKTVHLHVVNWAVNLTTNDVRLNPLSIC